MDRLKRTISIWAIVAVTFCWFTPELQAATTAQLLQITTVENQDPQSLDKKIKDSTDSQLNQWITNQKEHVTNTQRLIDYTEYRIAVLGITPLPRKILELEHITADQVPARIASLTGWVGRLKQQIRGQQKLLDKLKAEKASRRKT